MGKMLSTVSEVGSVTFPVWTGKRIYMRKFNAGEVPSDLEEFGKTIEDMTAGLSYKHGYLTIDEGIINAGSTQRRPGLHIDGNWVEGVNGISCHSPPDPNRPPGHIMCHGTPGHIMDENEQHLVLASSAVGCDVFIGEYEMRGEFNGGDCSYLDESELDSIRTKTGVAYVGGSCSMLHAAAPVSQTSQRTFVRLNLVK